MGMGSGRYARGVRRVILSPQMLAGGAAGLACLKVSWKMHVPKQSTLATAVADGAATVQTCHHAHTHSPF